jgi:hypothetical protein
MPSLRHIARRRPFGEVTPLIRAHVQDPHWGFAQPTALAQQVSAEPGDRLAKGSRKQGRTGVRPRADGQVGLAVRLPQPGVVGDRLLLRDVAPAAEQMDRHGQLGDRPAKVHRLPPLVPRLIVRQPVPEEGHRPAERRFVCVGNGEVTKGGAQCTGGRAPGRQAWRPAIPPGAPVDGSRSVPYPGRTTRRGRSGCETPRQ